MNVRLAVRDNKERFLGQEGPHMLFEPCWSPERLCSLSQPCFLLGGRPRRQDASCHLGDLFCQRLKHIPIREVKWFGGRIGAEPLHPLRHLGDWPPHAPTDNKKRGGGGQE